MLRLLFAGDCQDSMGYQDQKLDFLCVRNRGDRVAKALLYVRAQQWRLMIEGTDRWEEFMEATRSYYSEDPDERAQVDGTDAADASDRERRATFLERELKARTDEKVASVVAREQPAHDWAGQRAAEDSDEAAKQKHEEEPVTHKEAGGTTKKKAKKKDNKKNEEKLAAAAAAGHAEGPPAKRAKIAAAISDVEVEAKQLGPPLKLQGRLYQLWDDTRRKHEVEGYDFENKVYLVAILCVVQVIKTCENFEKGSHSRNP